ncbi:MAG: DUF2946 family protein [Pseudomonadota bacterium]
MNRVASGIRRITAWARLLPALALLVMQVSMAAMPVAASANMAEHPAEVQALFETLGVERITLCTPSGKQTYEKHDDHATHTECPWCQGFSETLLPVPPELFAPSVLSTTDCGFTRKTAAFTPETLDHCHPSRAPPALIRT